MASETQCSPSKLIDETSINSENDQNSSEISNFKDKFNKKLSQFYDSQSGNLKQTWSKQRVLEVIKHIKSGKVAISSSVRRTPAEYYWTSKYDTMQVYGEDCLILIKSSPDAPTIRVIAVEDYFDLLLEIHKECGHGGRNKIRNSIKDKFYIQIKAIEIFVALCPTCNIKRNQKIIKLLSAKDFNGRGQVDLIDFQSIPDKKYKWLLIYQDHATKFLHLRPLRSNQATEVALEVLYIFLEFGAPYLLQSGKDSKFIANILKEVVKLWPQCKIVYGTPQHLQTQEIEEGINHEVENLLRTWMNDYKTTNWSIGCSFVQYQKNLYHRIVDVSPYRALFGCDPKCRLQTSKISDVLKSINRDEQLDDIINNEIIHNSIPQTSVIIEKKYAGNIENQNISQISGISKEIEFIKTEYNETASEINSVLIEETEVSNIETDQNIQENSLIVPEIEVIASNIDNNEMLHNIHEISNDVVENFTNSSCVVCGKRTSGAHFCQSCLKPVHVTCGMSFEFELSNEDEGNGSKIYCFICAAEHNIKKEPEEADQSIKRVADKNIDETANKLPRLDIGNRVILNVPKIYRGPLDAKNVVGKILDSRHGEYQIGTKSGIINNWLSKCDLVSNEYKDKLLENILSLREVVIKETIFGGKGSQRCLCKTSYNQCLTNRCACFKKNVLCGSKCHSSFPCNNK